MHAYIFILFHIQVLVTSNDSRVRLYDLRDLTLTCKYKGYANNSSQIKASFKLVLSLNLLKTIEANEILRYK